MPLLLIAVATLLGIAGDLACKSWCERPAWWLFALTCAFWIAQSACWFPIYRASGLARALSVSSAMWLISSTAIGLFWFRESLTPWQVLGLLCCGAGIALLR